MKCYDSYYNYRNKILFIVSNLIYSSHQQKVQLFHFLLWLFIGQLPPYCVCLQPQHNPFTQCVLKKILRTRSIDFNLETFIPFPFYVTGLNLFLCRVLWFYPFPSHLGLTWLKSCQQPTIIGHLKVDSTHFWISMVRFWQMPSEKYFTYFYSVEGLMKLIITFSLMQVTN